VPCLTVTSAQVFLTPPKRYGLQFLTTKPHVLSPPPYYRGPDGSPGIAEATLLRYVGSVLHEAGASSGACERDAASGAQS